MGGKTRLSTLHAKLETVRSLLNSAAARLTPALVGNTAREICAAGESALEDAERASDLLAEVIDAVDE